MDSCPAIAAPKEARSTAVKGKYYLIREVGSYPMDMEELDRLHEQGLELVSETVYERPYLGIQAWRYVFRNQRRRNTMGPL